MACQGALETDLRALLACDPPSMDITQALDSMRRLKRARGFIDRLEADITSRVDSLHAAGRSAPVADVLSRSQGVSSKEAQRRERRAKALDEAPAFGDALGSGTVSAEHADVLATVTTKLGDDVRSEFFARQDALVERAATQSPEQFAKHCRSVLDRIAADGGVSRNDRQRTDTYLSKRVDRDGMYVLNARMHPELGARVFNDLDRETDAMASTAEWADVDRSRVAAEALGVLIGAGHGQRRPMAVEAVVLIDHETLVGGAHEHSIAELDSGVELPAETIRRLCCTAGIIPMVLDGAGVPLDQGRAKRLATHEQRLALRAMYRTCMFPECDVRFDDCEIHHLTPFEHGGRTDLADMGPLCLRHHHVVHEGGWQLRLDADRTLTIVQPDGVVFAVCQIEMPPMAPADRHAQRERERTRRTDDQTSPPLVA